MHWWESCSKYVDAKFIQLYTGYGLWYPAPMCKRRILMRFVSAILFSALIFCSCSDRMGYSVLLWNIPEYGLADGDIVPVYIKSNISQVYVIGKLDSDEKFEVPLWQITVPESKRNIKKTAEKFAEYQHQYARVVLDGLPIREDPDNIARQIYRLRKDEIIKVLYKGSGSKVMSGSNQMEGDWLRVLTSDGTIGWCFSYNLRLFDIRTEGVENPQPVATEEAPDENLNLLLTTLWYPESYGQMVSSHSIDTDLLQAGYCFDPGSTSGNVQLRVPGLTVVFPYAGIEKTSSNTYKFIDTPITVSVRSTGYIVVTYTNDRGMPTAYNFVTLTQPIEEIVNTELERRNQLYAQLESFGPKFSSSNYGTLQFTGENKFTWSGYKLLQSSIIPSSALGRGTVSFELRLDKRLTMEYDGVMVMHFDNTSDPVYFLYKIEETGLRMENIGRSQIRNNTVVDRSPNPVVLFFAR